MRGLRSDGRLSSGSGTVAASCAAALAAAAAAAALAACSRALGSRGSTPPDGLRAALLSIGGYAPRPCCPYDHGVGCLSRCCRLRITAHAATAASCSSSRGSSASASSSSSTSSSASLIICIVVISGDAVPSPPLRPTVQGRVRVACDSLRHPRREADGAGLSPLLICTERRVLLLGFSAVREEEDDEEGTT